MIFQKVWGHAEVRSYVKIPIKKKKNSSPIFTNEPETVAVHGKSNQSHKVV